MEIYQPTLPTAYIGVDTVYMSQINHSKELIGLYAYHTKEDAYTELGWTQPLIAVFIIKPKK